MAVAKSNLCPKEILQPHTESLFQLLKVFAKNRYNYCIFVALGMSLMGAVMMLIAAVVVSFAVCLIVAAVVSLVVSSIAAVVASFVTNVAVATPLLATLTVPLELLLLFEVFYLRHYVISNTFLDRVAWL